MLSDTTRQDEVKAEMVKAIDDCKTYIDSKYGAAAGGGQSAKEIAQDRKAIACLVLELICNAEAG